MRGPRWPGEKGARAFAAAAPPLPRGRITRPPRVGLLGLIGYLPATGLGGAALGVDFGLLALLRGDTSQLGLLGVSAVGVALFWWVNARLIIWWVRRPPEDRGLRRTADEPSR